MRSLNAGRYALIPLLPDEPVGVERLLRMTGHSIEPVNVTSAVEAYERGE